MPLSPDTSTVTIPVTPGVEYVISSDDGSVTVSSVAKENNTDYEYSEGSVASGDRMRYLGQAQSLKITPSAASVFWTVTKVAK